MNSIFKKAIMLTLASSVFAGAASAQNWAKIWKKELEQNINYVLPGSENEYTRAILMQVYNHLGFNPQFVFYEQQEKIVRLIDSLQYLSFHGMNPNDYEVRKILQSPISQEEKEVRIVTEIIHMAIHMSVGRVDPRSVAEHVKFGLKPFNRSQEIAAFIASPNEANLMRLAPRYDDYKLLYQALKSSAYTPAEREKIILSLEKFRWLPDAVPQQYLLVNTSSSMMNLVDPLLPLNSPLKRQKVINGQTSPHWRPTPSMHDVISTVILNPTWNVAHDGDIWNVDKLPKIKAAFNQAELQAPGSGGAAVQAYLDKSNFELVSRDNPNQTFYATEIPWQNIVPGTPVGFYLRQRPGESNALGVIKFHLLRNRDLIYLHDTGQRHLYDQSNRHLSSGCVRVHKYEYLAEYLLQGSSWTAAKIYNATNLPDSERETTELATKGDKKNFPVFMLHLTAQPVNGMIEFSNDAYKEDIGLKNALSQRGFIF